MSAMMLTKPSSAMADNRTGTQLGEFNATTARSCGISAGIVQNRPDSTINQQHQPTEVEADRNTSVSLLLTENHNTKRGWPSWKTRRRALRISASALELNVAWKQRSEWWIVEQ